MTSPFSSMTQVAPLSASHLVSLGSGPLFLSLGRTTSEPGVPSPSPQAGQPLLEAGPARSGHLSLEAGTPSPSESGSVTVTLEVSRTLSPSLTVTVISSLSFRVSGTVTLTLPFSSMVHLAPLSASQVTVFGRGPLAGSLSRVTSEPGAPVPSFHAGQPLLEAGPARSGQLSLSFGTLSPSLSLVRTSTGTLTTSEEPSG